MFDPPHLIKCVRNNLMKYSFPFGQHVATWKDIEAIYEKDTSLPIRSTPKLTEKHIHPNNFQKMKVKLATQVLSHTVAASLCMHVWVPFPQLRWEQLSSFKSLTQFLIVSIVLHYIP